MSESEPTRHQTEWDAAGNPSDHANIFPQHSVEVWVGADGYIRFNDPCRFGAWVGTDNPEMVEEWR